MHAQRRSVRAGVRSGMHDRPTTHDGPATAVRGALAPPGARRDAVGAQGASRGVSRGELAGYRGGGLLLFSGVGCGKRKGGDDLAGLAWRCRGSGWCSDGCDASEAKRGGLPRLSHVLGGGPEGVCGILGRRRVVCFADVAEVSPVPVEQRGCESLRDAARGGGCCPQGQGRSQGGLRKREDGVPLLWLVDRDSGAWGPWPSPRNLQVLVFQVSHVCRRVMGTVDCPGFGGRLHQLVASYQSPQ
ncbi:hypothetical protein BT67DRAFT_151680 [Trichocladium antarcticum]|uniref:Uncharacterized protein n=1 Tax=Trichocladium antarcticum TaxID=1450529 RepID=A0AAN6UEY3_9PEZI|nr:hypothetical protein BT67DRAFT_151680 [Trichocladium antarcticum]